MSDSIAYRGLSHKNRYATANSSGASPSPPAVAPAITSTNYDLIDVAGAGASIIITGTDFTGVTSVTFGGTNATSYVVNNSTQITAVAPAKAAGSHNVIVTHPTNGASNAYSVEYWSPASFGTVPALHLKAVSNTGYSVAAGNGTWLDTSGNAYNFSHATVAPAAGSTVQSHTPPDFNGISVSTTGTRLENLTQTLDDFIGISKDKYAIWSLIKRDTVPGTTDTNVIGTTFFADLAQYIGMGFYDDTAGAVGLYMYHYDSSYQTAYKGSLVVNTWYLCLCYIDATGGASPLQMIVNGSAGTSSAAALALGFGGSTIQLGTNVNDNLAGHDGSILEIGTIAGYVPTAGEQTKLLKYCRQRYGLTLT